MKTWMRRFSRLLLMLTLATTMYAQVSLEEKNQNITKNNLMVANPKLGYYPRIASWWDSGNGFICKVSLENVAYLTRFDRQGKYVETLVKKEWNDTASLQPSFRLSEYKSQKVTGYWEVIDVNKKGYYLEMNDKQNYGFSLWVDDKGNFSTVPSTKKINPAIAIK